MEVMIMKNGMQAFSGNFHSFLKVCSFVGKNAISYQVNQKKEM
jgi:hypothetical protein